MSMINRMNQKDWKSLSLSPRVPPITPEPMTEELLEATRKLMEEFADHNLVRDELLKLIKYPSSSRDINKSQY